MSHEHVIQVEGCSLTVQATRSDRPWGHAIEVAFVDADAAVRGKMVFGCHPEFRGFDQCQALSTEALIEIVRQRLTSSIVAESCSAASLGITLLRRFNSPEDSWDPSRTLAGS